jgi:hypothetical protein
MTVKIEVHVLQISRPVSDGRGLHPGNKIIHLRQHGTDEAAVHEQRTNGLLVFSAHLQLFEPIEGRREARRSIIVRTLHEAEQRVCHRADIGARRILRDTVEAGPTKHIA